MAKIYRLTSKSIYQNLAVEERLLHQAKSGSLLLYSNNATVVLGRNQNPWKECNLEYMRRERISLCRRRSGGGTVYHDLGNLCYSFVSSKDSHNKNRNTKIIVDTLRDRFGLDASMNERNDVLVEGRKTSGAAYRITKGFAYHHGTLLVDSDLDKLQRSISSPELQKINTKATNSVRSKVINLREKDRHITVDDVSRALEENFREQNNIEASTVVVGPESMTPEDYAEEAFLCERKWIFGETPEFNVPYAMNFNWGQVLANFTVARGGSISKAEFTGPEGIRSIAWFGEALVGVDFAGSSISKKLLQFILAGPQEKSFIVDVATYLQVVIPNQISAVPARMPAVKNEWETDPMEI